MKSMSIIDRIVNVSIINLIIVGLVAIGGIATALAISSSFGSNDSPTISTEPELAKSSEPTLGREQARAAASVPEPASEPEEPTTQMTVEPDFLQAYNCQAVVDSAHQVIVAARATPDYKRALAGAGISTFGWKTDFSRHTVQYDEIISGGPPRDGIPPIDSPSFVSPKSAEG